MTMCSMYVGDLRGFDFDGNQDGNLPPGLTGPFPPVHGSSYHGALQDWAKRMGLPVIQVDFDGYVVRVTKAQVLAFVSQCFDSDETYTVPEKMWTWKGRPYLVDKLNLLKEQIAALAEAGDYGLVSECF